MQGRAFPRRVVSFAASTVKGSVFTGHLSALKPNGSVPLIFVKPSAPVVGWLKTAAVKLPHGGKSAPLPFFPKADIRQPVRHVSEVPHKGL